jgi:CRP-like cAMP-binding protein
MGGQGLLLEFEGIDTAALEQMVVPIWDVLFKFVRGTRTKQLRYIFEGYLDSYRYEALDEGFFGARGNTIHYYFHDPGGCCALSVAAARHWTRLALAACGADVEALAARHGGEFRAPKLDLWTEIQRGPEHGVFVPLRRKLWKAEDIEGELILFGNDEQLIPSSAEARSIRAQLTMRRCECPACRWKRRDLLRTRRPTPPWTTELITDWVCAQFGVAAADLPGSKRGKDLARARAVIALLASDHIPEEWFRLSSFIGQGPSMALEMRGLQEVAEHNLSLPPNPPLE